MRLEGKAKKEERELNSKDFYREGEIKELPNISSRSEDYERGSSLVSLTPLDIQNKEDFSTTFRGYCKNEVAEFLDKVSKEFEKLIKKNLICKNNSASLRKSWVIIRALKKPFTTLLLLPRKRRKR